MNISKIKAISRQATSESETREKRRYGLRAISGEALRKALEMMRDATVFERRRRVTPVQ